MACEDVLNPSHAWLCTAYKALMNAKPVKAAQLDFKLPPAAITYLFSTADGQHVYVGECDRDDGGRVKAHLKRLGKGFGAAYQSILGTHGVPASDADTLAAIRELQLRWRPEPDAVRRQRLEYFVVALDAPLCNRLGSRKRKT